MLTFISGVFISLMISIFGQETPCQYPPDKPSDLKYSNPIPDDKVIGDPFEALGGGFKKYRQ